MQMPSYVDHRADRPDRATLQWSWAPAPVSRLPKSCMQTATAMIDACSVQRIANFKVFAMIVVDHAVAFLQNHVPNVFQTDAEKRLWETNTGRGTHNFIFKKLLEYFIALCWSHSLCAAIDQYWIFRSHQVHWNQ